MNRLDPYKTSIEGLGLNQETLGYQANLLDIALRQQKGPTFPVLDTCRLGNGGILPEFLPATAPGEPWAKGYAAFTLAAGAASRYSQPLFALSEALAQADRSGAVAALAALAKEGASSWPLPAQFTKLVEQPARLEELGGVDLMGLGEHLQLPKALMPCVRDGVSFLAMKHLENAKLPGLTGQVFITPPGMQKAFTRHLEEELGRSHLLAAPLPTAYLEQGPALSTIRFERSGRPFREPTGEVSPVPAGHGALAQLFPAALTLFPGTDALFIRNIDNIMGTTAEVLAATERFLCLHRRILTTVQTIRTGLARSDLSLAGSAAAALLVTLGLDRQQHEAAPEPLELPNGPEGALWRLQIMLFHCDLEGARTPERLLALYARPVNLLGQVPNIHHDVGGTPCFIAMPKSDATGHPGGSKRGKVCLEVVHASPDDQRAKLADHDKATHFNPGFCAVEITADPLHYSKRNHHFWLMAEKVYRGQQVVYYETALYELIGHSDFANTAFVEVPRRVFNPHKTLRDALNRTLASWLPA